MELECGRECNPTFSRRSTISINYSLSYISIVGRYWAISLYLKIYLN